jgi:hypothetical protein
MALADSGQVTVHHSWAFHEWLHQAFPANPENASHCNISLWIFFSFSLPSAVALSLKYESSSSIFTTNQPLWFPFISINNKYPFTQAHPII